jgi:hypothetical protein
MGKRKAIWDGMFGRLPHASAIGSAQPVGKELPKMGKLFPVRTGNSFL